MSQEVSCACLEGDTFFKNFEKRAIGMDSNFGEVSVVTCTRCGRTWLHYLIEVEYLSRSGRWFRGVVAPAVAASIKPAEAVNVLESLEWYFRGGSAFGGEIIQTRGPLEPWLIPCSGPE